MPQSRRCRPSGRDKIDREHVVAAALTIIDRAGLDSLSIRGLAASIDRDPMTVYRYVSTKQALLDAVADHVLASLPCVVTTDPQWTYQLRLFARQYRELALRHPHAAILLATRPPSTPLGLGTHSSLAPVDGILELLTTAGFTASDAISSYRSLLSYLRGHILSEAQETVERPEDTADRLRIAVRRFPADRFPLLSTFPPIVTDYDGDRELERGLDTLLHGLDGRLARPAHVRP
ncbi:TetR/AcrR family transcriptional regulator C-terminal domain-containing protein [Rhodococcus sp. 14-2483-1-2]|uniref:TetR/AcrR family transcriptional regulator C-terminal domain-containing protein n=1 Tax=Rhodococcus sp. 14-2483-1-2 TaxID=2023147 RepID=UPI00207B2DBF|nr:TetR/AcrR family transcriptional regulator C-terminal domain-containing protein [Rhodococcus sp. 14-2483-1-2]